MLVIAAFGHSKEREVVHSIYYKREGSIYTVEMSYNKMGHWLYNIIIMCLCVFSDAKTVYSLQYREMYSHV